MGKDITNFSEIVRTGGDSPGDSLQADTGDGNDLRSDTLSLATITAGAAQLDHFPDPKNRTLSLVAIAISGRRRRRFKPTISMPTQHGAHSGVDERTFFR